ncbi:conserved hypothetical protein [Rubrivivax sp. A210]|uniref:hypothetical protein n=1 Tax=Rubrivivax sp. A210 TaxID=2772301 RepID=UPI001918CBEA|nr:hypothetical protein [Rubrivivax sp. A210]CAD5366546.1 conserved hypothetical protein [Rubrivivax sp. A210]
MTAPKNPKPLGLPISIPAAQAMANMKVAEEMDTKRAARRAGTKVSMNALKPAEVAPFARTATERQPNKSEREAAAMRASYLVGDTTPSAVNLSVKDIPGPMLLEVTDIDCFDLNPRLFANEKVEDIEVSIRAGGFHDALVVTRRRDGDRYMLAAGSNTTLRILQELWRTTQNERYRWVNCIYQPYESDARLLAQHLGENLNRGDMKFWEIAKGMVDLLDQIEGEARAASTSAKPMSLRNQADALNARGLRANKSDISLWRFAVSGLSELGEKLQALTFRGVQDHIQPKTNALCKLASKFGIDEAAFWSEVVRPTLAIVAGSHANGDIAVAFDAAELCDQIEAAFAYRVSEPVSSIRQMLSLLKLSPELTLVELRMPSPNLIAGGPGERESTADASLAPEAEKPNAAAPALQAALPLGPGQVRGAGVNPPATRRAPSPPADVDPAAGLPATRTPAAAPKPSVAGPLFDGVQGDADPLQFLHTTVERLLFVAGLQDTLRYRDEMPLGFFIEMPDPTIHARRKVAPGSPEHGARAVKTVVWWSLVLMTGQFRDGCVPYIDHDSRFFRHYSVESEATSPLHGTDIEQSAPELDEMLMHRLTPGQMREAMQALRDVEEAAVALLDQRPERWRRMLELRQAWGGQS